MSTTEVRSVDMKVEVITIPVSDVDRAKDFYGKVGWRLDVTPPGVVQFTPPGSGCSVQFGANRTSAAPGSAQNMFLVVSDIQAARDQLVAAGIEVSEVSHPGPDGPVSGPDPEHRSYLSFASFKDPDGNSWLLQEITTRLPGASKPPRLRSTRRTTWRTRCGAPRQPTASTKSAPARPTRTGPTGTPTTWWRSTPGPNCLCERRRVRTRWQNRHAFAVYRHSRSSSVAADRLGSGDP